MEAEKKLDTIEEEMKLLKGELKQSLASVRDYLLNMELPSSEFSTILAALSNDGGGGGSQHITIEGNLANTGDQAPGGFSDGVEEVTEEEIPEPEDELSLGDNDILDSSVVPKQDLAESEDLDQPDNFDRSEDLAYEPDILEPEQSDDDVNADELDEPGDMEDQDKFYAPATKKARPSLEEDPLMGYEKTNTDLQPSTPRVNLLANLINWVAKAKKEIGYEQLSTFLEVYGVSGHLSPELKEAILQLAEIAAEQSDASNRADVWSQSMLSLHGILTGGDAPLYPFKSTAFNTENEDMISEEEIIEVDKPKEQPVKLKLVFPNGDGDSKEFCVDLTPSVDTNES